jgi:DNA-directed RNA polymerase subunit RPC12/RpoP
MMFCMTDKVDQVAWHAAGLADDELRLDRPLRARILLPPAVVRAREGRIEWTHDQEPRDPPGVVPGPRLLTEFVRQADGSDAQILEFVRRWGPLGLCKHELPASHNPWGQHPGCVVRSMRKDSQGVRWYWEPFNSFRAWAWEARGIVTLAANTYQGMVVNLEGWREHGRSWEKTRFLFGEDGRDLFSKHTPENQRYVLGQLVHEWLEIGGVQPFWRVRPGGSSIVLGGFGVFGALATQLLFVVSRTKGFSVCASCGRPFSPKHQPLSTRLNYCSRCGLRAAQKEASKNYRRRVAEARQLSSEGIGIRKIAKQLNRDIASVTRWVVGEPARRRS